MMFSDGVRGSRKQIQFDIEYRPVTTPSTHSADPQRDFLSFFDPQKLDHALQATPEQLPLLEDTEMTHAVTTGENRYVFTMHTLPPERGVGQVKITVSGIMENPKRGNSSFGTGTSRLHGLDAYRHFIEIVKFEYEASTIPGMLSSIAANHKKVISSLDIPDEPDENAAMIVALAAGQHKRLGKDTQIISLDTDVFRVLVDSAYPRTLTQRTLFMLETERISCTMAEDMTGERGHGILFHPYPADNADAELGEILKMRDAMKETFKVRSAYAKWCRYGLHEITHPTSGDPIRYDQHLIGFEYHGFGSDNYRITVSGKAVVFKFQYHGGSPCVRVDHIAHSEQRFTGLRAFMVFIKTLEKRLSAEDKAYKAYDEPTPKGFIYGSQEMRLDRILQDRDQSTDGKITFYLNQYAFDATVKKFDRLFNPTEFIQRGTYWHIVQERTISVGGKLYTFVYDYKHTAKDWEDDDARCDVYGLHETDETYIHRGYFECDVFNFFLELLAANLTDEDRSRPRMPPPEYIRANGNTDDEEDGDD